MRFTSKNENYFSLKGGRGVFKNPYVQTTKCIIDTENQKLTVSFSLQYEQNEVINVLETNDAVFTAVTVPTMIENDQGVLVEIIEYLSTGGLYAPEKVSQWGIPSFLSVQSYFDLDSVWSDLAFKATPFKQLAIDWVMNNVKVEGVSIKNYFELDQTN